MPSVLSAICCVTGSVTFVAVSVFLDSINYGTIAAGFDNGAPATLYTNDVVQPMERLLHSVIWSSLVAILFWAVVGVVVYELLGTLFKVSGGWRIARRDVQYINEREIVRHPLEKSFILQGVWRMCLSLVGFLALFAAQPAVSSLFGNIHNIVLAKNGAMVLRNGVVAVTAWAFIFHLIVVFLRLYTLRTRLFGDPNIFLGEHSKI